MNRQEDVVKKLMNEKKELERVITEASRRLSKAPEGTINVANHKGSIQYYRRLDPKDRNGIYIPVSEQKLVKALVQKKYDQQVLRAARRQLKLIDRFLKAYDPAALEDVYTNSSENRRALIDPAAVPDQIFAAQWQAQPFVPKDFAEGTSEHFTHKDERVRSKSEVIIANALYRAGIPYRYECPLQLGDRILYPDFTVLRVSDRKEILWEHLGMMDDTEYRQNAFLRLRQYEDHGIYLGDRLIITAETFRFPLNLATVNKLIHHYFA